MIRVGTSGWSYRHWRGSVYPPQLDAGQWLSWYASHLRSVEINNSFYQLPAESTLARWADTVDRDFTFSVKAGRYITHMKKLKDPEEPLRHFLSAISTLGRKLSRILFQLPARWQANPERLADFLRTFHREKERALPEALAEQLRPVFEFRDPSWFAGDVYEVLRSHDAAFCIYELGNQRSPKIRSSQTVYIRLHGPGDRYQGRYSPQDLAGWAGAVSTWSRQGHDVDIYFDNDQQGYAALNAIELHDMLSNGDKDA